MKTTRTGVTILACLICFAAGLVVSMWLNHERMSFGKIDDYYRAYGAPAYDSRWRDDTVNTGAEYSVEFWDGGALYRVHVNKHIISGLERMSR